MQHFIAGALIRQVCSVNEGSLGRWVGREHQPKKYSEFSRPKNDSYLRPAAVVRDLTCKFSVYVLHFVHRTECYSIFSKASSENPTALSNINVELHNQGSCKDKTEKDWCELILQFVISSTLWITCKRSNGFGSLWYSCFFCLFFFGPLIPLKYCSLQIKLVTVVWPNFLPLGHYVCCFVLLWHNIRPFISATYAFFFIKFSIGDIIV